MYAREFWELAKGRMFRLNGNDWIKQSTRTATEQSAESTINDNGVGFTPADARMGTSMAQFYTKFGRLSEKQLAYWRKPNARGIPRICKYAGQLLQVAKAKAEQKAEAC